MAKVKKSSKQSAVRVRSPFKSYWYKYNIYLIYFGIGLLILGFYLMGSKPFDNPVGLSLSTIIILFAYLAIFPLAILFKKKEKKDSV